MAENVVSLTSTKPRLAFVGTGWIGFNRMKALVGDDSCNPYAVSDPVKENVRRAVEIAPDAIVCSTLEEVIEAGPDGIVIATPSALHAQQSIQALNAGIPVFCQKPLARTATEAYEIIETARKKNKLLGVDLSYRFTDGMQKIYSIINEGILGRIYAADLVFHNAYGPDKPWFYDPVLSGGGCLIDLGIHLVDLALWTLDYPGTMKVCSTLRSNGRRIADIKLESEDYVSAQFETSTGAVVRLTCSWNLPAGKDAEIKASFYGTNAAAVFENIDGSFYDFATYLNHGTSSKVISMPPDDWGGRALIHWTRQLQKNDEFDSNINSYLNVAEVTDKIYGRSQKPA